MARWISPYEKIVLKNPIPQACTKDAAPLTFRKSAQIVAREQCSYGVERTVPGISVRKVRVCGLMLSIPVGCHAKLSQ